MLLTLVILVVLLGYETKLITAALLFLGNKDIELIATTADRLLKDDIHKKFTQLYHAKLVLFY